VREGALAYLHNRHWSRTGLAKSSFYYALKKVKKIFHADKHWAKLHSTRKKHIRGLDSTALLHPIGEGTF